RLSAHDGDRSAPEDESTVNWNDRIISDEELSSYLKDRRDRRWAARVGALIEQQRATWPLLAKGIAALTEVETRRVPVAESAVTIQHNPHRLRSTAAAVDKGSVEKRPCFLCAENLPPEEKGLAYGEKMGIFCNPFPIMNQHLTIVHRRHVEQTIRGNFEWLLRLAADLAPDYFALYNGPQCGASAPDHLHFQACSRGLLPIAEDLRAETAADPAHCEVCEAGPRDQFELFTMAGCGRSVIVLRGNHLEEIAQWFYRIIDELPRPDDHTEPMMNIVCIYELGTFTAFLFPRTKHRPASFFAEGDARLIVSPGAIDMAGVIITPRREDFARLDGGRVEAIFGEVSYKDEQVNEILERLLEGREAGDSL
ncbi:MAG TPA: DUF4922 domain-containing protein, partial [Pyrinomonadaceae bacterium]|nr:DUF4922 domain-containing protein [Pyrinomonadaceae bacterium]